MSLNFNKAAVTSLFKALVSQASQLNVWDRSVIAHEPRSAPGSGMSCALWWGRIAPHPRGSGMAAVSGVVVFHARIYKSFLAKPEDDIDPDLLYATCLLLAQLSGSFTLGRTVRNIDLFGEAGQPLEAQPGYIEHDGKHFRVSELSMPIVINDLWTENA